MAKQMDLKREPGPWMNEHHPIDNPRADMRWMGESLTRQSEAEACDINVIMKRFEATGMLPEMIKNEPSYGDFSQSSDFLEAQNIIAFANSQFHALDARTRRFFDDNPAKMLEYVEQAADDPDKQKNLIKLGLAVGTPQPEAPVSAQAPASGALSKKKGAGAQAPVSAEPEAE